MTKPIEISLKEIDKELSNFKKQINNLPDMVFDDECKLELKITMIRLNFYIAELTKDVDTQIATHTP